MNSKPGFAKVARVNLREAGLRHSKYRSPARCTYKQRDRGDFSIHVLGSCCLFPLSKRAINKVDKFGRS
jgi:hypothetical protein